jgi:hypothetical protein
MQSQGIFSSAVQQTSLAADEMTTTSLFNTKLPTNGLLNSFLSTLESTDIQESSMTQDIATRIGHFLVATI